MSQFLKLLKRPFANNELRTEKRLEDQINRIRTLEDEYSSLPDEQLHKHLAQHRISARALDLGCQNEWDEILIKTAAIGSCAVYRVMGFRLHDVQLKGAVAASSGAIIQMNTGEGKTMVCGLSALIRSVFDTSVHVATTNAYLAERDHETVQPIFELVGTTSAFIGPDSSPNEIRAGYRRNITYAPGYMFGFDYLRDQLQLREYESVTLGRDILEELNGQRFSDSLAQTSHDCIIVDEADSVLIDESTTPLLLSGSSDEATESALQAYVNALTTSKTMQDETHFMIDQSKKTIDLTDQGLELIHNALNEYGRMDLCQPWTKYIINALYAEHFLVRDEDYVVEDEQIKLVDQNTGRIFDDRSLRAGLHQALEAKEGVTINPPNSTMARVTRQRFFQLYPNVCGMTGTAVGIEAELKHFYDVDVVPLPPNKPCKRIELPDRFFRDWDSKTAAIVEEVVKRQATGQPILIGTRTIRESQQIEEAIADVNIDCQVLNGIQDEDEAELVAEAGQCGKVIIATNMAGRGTDIKLTADAKAAGGLHVIGTQRFESRRVDNQLAGRAARQGDPGSCQFFISADDKLIDEHSKPLAKKICRTADQQTGESSLDLAAEIEQLQASIEISNFESRKKLVHQERWLDQVRETMAGV